MIFAALLCALWFGLGIFAGRAWPRKQRRTSTLYELSCKHYGKEYTDAQIEGVRIMRDIAC